MTEDEIDELGFMLEDKGMSHEAIDAYFEHVGKKGMKWGIRRGKSKTGLPRAYGAKIDANNITRRAIERKKNGETFFKKIHNEKKLDAKYNRLTDQNKRLASGKATVKDRRKIYGSLVAQLVVHPAFVPFGPPAFGLAVSRHPK